MLPLPATATLTDAAHESVVFVIVVIVALSVVEAAYVTHCILCVCVCVECSYHHPEK